MQRLLPPHLFLLCIAAMAAPDQLLPVTDVITDPWRWLGAPIALAGSTINVVSAVKFKRLGTNIIPFRDPGSVVETGLFALTRNPMYLGFTVALAGIAIMLGSLLCLVPVAIFFIAADRWYIPHEERRLRTLFGGASENYCKRVRRWI